MAIDLFRGEYYFLSNMCPLDNGIEVLPEGVLVPTSEHGFQVSKFTDPNARREILRVPSGFSAKRRARELVQKEGFKRRPDWEELKLNVMRYFVRQKFLINPGFAVSLIATGQEELIEGNNRGDTFWGACPRGSHNGENHLGRILMETRTMLQQVPLPDELSAPLVLPLLPEVT